MQEARLDFDAQLQHVKATLGAHDIDWDLRLQRVMTFLHAQNEHYHWVGIYLLKENQLHLGPFAGPPTDHQVIPVGRGVCGTAVAENKDQIIDDVSQLSNYLACNLETKSEAVMLIRDRLHHTIIGQLDVDGARHALFDQEQRQFLQQLISEIENWWPAD